MPCLISFAKYSNGSTSGEHGGQPNSPTAYFQFQGGELGEWDENSGWEDQTLDTAAREALMERKRQQRERRAWEQQQKRQERSGRPAALGARLNA